MVNIQSTTMSYKSHATANQDLTAAELLKKKYFFLKNKNKN
jgi:hypothetical protein